MGFSTGLANPNDYNLGRGLILLSDVDANGFPTQFRDLGNAPEFTVSLESERIEHQSSRAGLKVTDKEAIVSQSMSVSFTLDEVNLDNLALFLSGETLTPFAHGGAAVTGDTNLTVVDQGRWYELYDLANPSVYPPDPAVDTFNRVYHISTVAIGDAGSPPSYTEGTDFDVDYNWGLIFVREGGGMAAGDYDVDFTIVATTLEQIAGLTQAEISGALKFISRNAANSGRETHYQFHSVTIGAEGDFSLIGDDFSQMQFTGKAEAREAVDADAPTVRVTTYATAGDF